MGRDPSLDRYLPWHSPRTSLSALIVPPDLSPSLPQVGTSSHSICSSVNQSKTKIPQLTGVFFFWLLSCCTCARLTKGRTSDSAVFVPNSDTPLLQAGVLIFSLGWSVPWLLWGLLVSSNTVTHCFIIQSLQVMSSSSSLNLTDKQRFNIVSELWKPKRTVKG